MKRAMNAAVYAQGNVYWRIGAKRNCSVAEIRETKSPKGIELARSAKRIPYVDALEKSNEV